MHIFIYVNIYIYMFIYVYIITYMHIIIYIYQFDSRPTVLGKLLKASVRSEPNFTGQNRCSQSCFETLPVNTIDPDFLIFVYCFNTCPTRWCPELYGVFCFTLSRLICVP